MGRCDRRCLAISIKRSLSKIDKMMVREAMKIEVDALMYEFARLHGIGVIPTIDEDLRTEYTFFNNPEAICNFDKMRMGFDSASINIFWENVDSDLLFRSLHYVTDKLDLRDWRLYLELNDCVSSRAAIPRTRMLDLSTGGPGRDALERMMRISRYVDTDSIYPKFNNIVLNYTKKDVESTMDLYKRLEEKKNTIKKVIFHDPATIIYWEDGTKTVVKVQNGEKFDPEKGMAMAICKKTHGNDGSYYEAFKKFLPKEEKVGVFDFDVCLHVFAEIQNLEVVGPDPESGVIKLIDMLNDDRVYAVVDRKTITADEWDALHNKMLKYFKSPAPKDLNNISDAVTINTEAEQYTGETPKEVSDCNTLINIALAAFVEDVGCLEALYDPERSMYHIRDKNHFEKAPYALAVDSPIAEISPTALTQLKLDICKYFDI